MTPSSFLDPRTHDFTRVALIVPRVHLADPLRNAQAHLEQLTRARELGASYAVAPELGLSGYSAGDLFHSRALLDACLHALETLAHDTRDWDLLFSVGLPLALDGAIYNCAATLLRGQVLAVAPKSYLPNYGEFYETRHFAPARHAHRDHLTLLGRTVPFGNDIVLRSDTQPAFALHVEVCEDLWVPVPPSTRAALAGATVLSNLSASNITIGKASYREQLVCGHSARNLAACLYVAAGHGESTADLSWDGDGYIAERGLLLTRAPRFDRDPQTVTADIDLHSLLHDRRRMNSFRDNAHDLAPPTREVPIPGRLGPPTPLTTLERRVPPHPFVPADETRRDARCREVFNIQATSLARRLEVFPPERRRLVLGLSGGQDSTHALLVAAHAMDRLELPRDRILCLTMPGFGTTDRTYTNACTLARALGAELREHAIRDLATTVFQTIGHDPDTHDLTYENTQAWLRKVLELATASHTGAIDLGTGDLSELALGWCTMFGDHASHYGVNAGVPKTLISHVIRWTADAIFANEPDARATLLDILDTPVSPELLPPDAQGEIAQKTEDTIGPYELHDFALYHLVRFGAPPARIARLALHAFDGRYDLPTIKRWLREFLRRFMTNQFKRNCLPDGPKVGLTALSPRGDWRAPSDASPATWLQALDAIPDEF